jgi:hypothetical protein
MRNCCKRYVIFIWYIIDKQGKKKKYGCVLVNEGDKLTKEQKEKLQEEN